ncbi:MAG TPA: hypothetical protein VG370_02125 [Chloroflexota bacterium]|nr:hypothetical protein [Chloroflexota bacterium]
MEHAPDRAAPSPATLVALLGGFPPAPPLAPSVLAVAEVGRHSRALVEYATADGERVQAFLLVPKNVAGPTPGIVAIHQDGGARPYAHGKSEPAGLGGDPELAYGRELCERGYVVLCPDRFGFESRSLANSPAAEAFGRFRIFKEDGLELTEDLWLGCVANQLLHQGRVELTRFRGSGGISVKAWGRLSSSGVEVRDGPPRDPARPRRGAADLPQRRRRPGRRGGLRVG